MLTGYIFVSPLIVERYGDPSGTINTKVKLKEYFSVGLSSIPNLKFELVDILYGVKGFTMYYKNAKGGYTAEYMELDKNNKVCYVINTYTKVKTKGQ